ncbi:MAG: putative MPP superfamily phosphohydrolase [Candidatus Poriferisodalaceae bacterium]|jgi:predicted MPP superfamily phosphohydrolase
MRRAHTNRGHRIYVSTGIGVEREDSTQVRFGVRPTIAVLEFVPTD